MEEQLIRFETAKLAKEKGFKESVLYHYWRINGDNSDFEKSPRPNSELIREVDTVMSPDQGKNGCTVSVEMLNRNYLWEGTHPILGECKSFIAVPTQALLQKWMREVHNIDVCPIVNYSHYKKGNLTGEKTFRLGIIYIENDLIESFFLRPEGEKVLFMEYSTWEEALEAGLYHALQLIK